jgi:hypothetical protein
LIEPLECLLEYVPTGDVVRAVIISLTPEIVSKDIMDAWWHDEALKVSLDTAPIDRDWDWTELEIERDGKVLESELVGVVTGDGHALSQPYQ